MTGNAPPGASPEIRQNKATGQWVIYSPIRGKRPSDFRRSSSSGGELPVLDPECPFCPGNEEALDSIILEMPGPKMTRWHVRVIPNKYPALVPGIGRERTESGIYLTMPGFGRHEVVIESPNHAQLLAAMSPAEVEIVIEAYHRRYVDLMREHDSMMTIIFRNHGPKAGTSLAHPHSQIIVTGIVPNHIRWREAKAERYHDQWGRCVHCDILAFEMSNRRRVIFESEEFLGFIPFAAEVPFEIWLAPKRHQADFGSITDRQKTDLAAALSETLGKLHTKLNDPDYNYVINTAARYRSEEPQLHWYLQIRPRLTTPAGFEIGSGICINPSLPEADAEFLNTP